MSDSLLNQLLDRTKEKGLQAEIYYQSSQDTPIEFENNRLKSLQKKAVQGVALRVIHQGKLGFASSTDLSRLDDLLDSAIETAEMGDPVSYEFAKNVHNFEAKKDYIPPDTTHLVQMGEQLITQVHDYNPDILVSVGFHVRSGETKLLTTDDVYSCKQYQVLSTSLSGNLVRGEDFLEAYSYEVTEDREADYQGLLEKLLTKYKRAQTNSTISSGSYPVLFTPSAVSSTIGGLFDTILSGQVVVQKASPLADKLGEKLFDDRFSLYEDPSLGISACKIDDEGTPTTKKILVDRGVVQQFYWDRRWASQAGCQSTGNGFRGGLSRPHPDLVNLCISQGNSPIKELIKGIKEGVMVDQVLGAGQSNQLAGEFSVNLDLGYKIENGEIVGRLKNTMVAGSIFEAFNQLVDFSDQCEWVGGSSYVPYILFDRLGVASRDQ